MREPTAARWAALEETSVRDPSPDEIDTCVSTAENLTRALTDRARPASDGN